MKAVLEEISPRESHSFAAFQFSMPRFLCPYHYHPEIELTLIVAGRGQRLVGDHLAPFSPGDLVLMGAELPHSYFHSPGFNEGPKGASSIVIQFRPDLAGGLLHSPECRRIFLLLEKSKRGLTFEEKTRARVARLMPELVKAEGPPRLALLLEILHGLSSDSKATPLAGRGFRPVFNVNQAGRIGKICDWLTAHFQEPITLGQAAKKAHLTPAAFSRFFHRATNRPFVRFLNELRVSHACRLLLETDKAIAEIAFESGFENLSNFNRRFRDLKGITPRDFRSALPVRIS